MKVLVTGGAGYIGSCVVHELLKRGHQVKVLDLFYWGKQSLRTVLKHIEVIQGDARNSKTLLQALEGVDAVIHLAGIVGEGACNKNYKAHFTANIQATKTLLDCCTDPELPLIKDFIYASSCSIYGNTCNMDKVVYENSIPHPLSTYAHAKLRSEQEIMQRGITYPSFNPTILRLSTVFGWSHRPRLDLVTNRFVYTALTDKKICIYGQGSQYRSLIYILDVATAFADVLEAPGYKRSNEVFHVGAEINNKKVREIAEIIKDQLPATKIQYKKEASTDKRDYSINCDKINNIIGWYAKHNVYNGMRYLIEDMQGSTYNLQHKMFYNNNYEYE